MNEALHVGDSSINGQVTIVDEDRLCYIVHSVSKGAEGNRTISKKLLKEFVRYRKLHPNSTSNNIRTALVGLSDIDRFEYGYASTLLILADMVIDKQKKTSDESAFLKHRAQRPLQLIIYGTPGSGKSNKVRKEYDEKYPKWQVIRTTFHPDTDYASFIGGNKPVAIKDKDGNEKISYRFVPQCFTEAYVRAWNDLGNPYFLIIEEINRGNCAQIFGDTFQLLDRNENGYSEYPIDADADLKKYLEDDGALKNEAGIANGQLCLPPNLSIIATMNTSDQSLFPMDTAFKRRWAWEYVPIEYDNKTSSQFKINIGDEQFDWPVFLKAVNKEIKRLTSSEDKQMGNFFIKHSVDESEFINKVMYYLWSEVGKDNYQTSDALFLRYADGKDGSKTDFSFNELYEEGKTQKLLDFMHIIIDNKEA